MVDYTRRTHVVRIPMDGKAVPSQSPTRYVDIEVLDAIAFRIENGKEVIIDLKAANSAPYIVDHTGGGHGRKPGDPTQRTHMERVSHGKSKIDVEVIDVLACRDQNGREWILDMRDGLKVYNVTDHTGDRDATRRVHDEKVYVGGKAPASGKSSDKYVTSERCDNIAFRTINGYEVIFNCASYDDGKGKRAATYVWSPRNYNPADKNSVPPTNKDAHVYVAPVAGASGSATDFLTAAEKIKMGPFWWIRKVQSGEDAVLVLIFEAAINWAFVAPHEFNVFVTGVQGGNFDMLGDFLVSPEGADNPLPHAGDGLALDWFGYAPFTETQVDTQTLTLQVADQVEWHGIVSGVDTHEFFVILNPGTPQEAVDAMSSGYAIEFGHLPDGSHVPPDLGAYPFRVITSHSATMTVSSTSKLMNSIFFIPIPALQSIADQDDIASFQILVSHPGRNASGHWALSGITFKVSDDLPALDFPADDQTLPLFSPAGSVSEFDIFKTGEGFGGFTVDVTVNVKTLEVTGVAHAQ